MEPPLEHSGNDWVQWELLDASGDIPEAEGLHGHSTVLHDGKLYIYGGASHGFATSAFFVFDVAKRQWTVENPTGDALPVSADHFAIKLGSVMVTYGTPRFKDFSLAPRIKIKYGMWQFLTRFSPLGGRGHAQRRNGVDSCVTELPGAKSHFPYPGSF